MPERAVSYRLILPPTWQLIPLGERSDAAIAAILDAQFAGLPMDKYGPRKKQLAKSLQALADSARSTGGIDMILPTAMPWQVPLSAGIVVSELRSAAPSSSAVADLMAAMLQDRTGATMVDGKAGASIREVKDFELADGADPQAASRLRTAHYTWPVPGNAGGWLISTLTVSGQAIEEYRPITEALTELFDVMMQTLAWSNVEEPA